MFDGLLGMGFFANKKISANPVKMGPEPIGIKVKGIIHGNLRWAIFFC